MSECAQCEKPNNEKPTNETTLEEVACLRQSMMDRFDWLEEMLEWVLLRIDDIQSQR